MFRPKNSQKPLGVQAAAQVLYEAVPDGIITADIKTRRIINVNPGACKLFGYTAKELLAKPIAKLHPASEIGKALRPFRKLAREKMPLASDIPCIKKDGTVFFADISARPAVLDKRQCLVGVFRDITERKLAEEREGEISRRFRAIFDSTFQFIAILKPGGEVLEVNQSALKFGGLSMQDVRDRFFWNCHWWTISRRTQQNVRKAVAQAARGKFVRYPVQVLGKGGMTIIIDFSLKPVRNKKGQVTLLTAEGRDITESKQADEKARKSLSLERATLESTADGILVIDRNGKVADFNDRFAQLWNMPSKVLQPREDKKLLKYVLPQLKDPERFMSKVAELYRHPHKKSFDVLEFKDGRIFERYSHPQFLEGKPVGRVWSFRDATKRKKAEEALQESEARYRAIFEQAADAIVVFDPQTLAIADFNDEACQRLGYTREEFAQFKVSDFEAAESVEEVKRHSQQMVVGQVAVFETKHRAKNGAVLDVEIRGRAVVLGNKTMIQGVWRDVTARKRADRQLLESEERYRSLFKSILNGVAYCKMLYRRGRPWDFIYLDVNKAFEEQTGLKGVTGKKVSEVIPGLRKADPKLFEIYGRVARTGIPEQFETYVKALKMWFAISVYSSQKGHFVALFDVVTERKLAEQALCENEEKFRSVTEQSPNMIFINQGGKVVYANHQCERVMGYKLKELYAAGFNFLSLVHPDDRAVARHNFQAHQQGKEVAPFEYKLVTKNRKILNAILTTKLISYQGRKVILGIMTDITERKKNEHDLLASETRYRRLFEAAKDGILILDAETGMVDQVNPYLIKLLGYSHKAFLGKKLWELGFLKDIVPNKAHFLELQRKKYVRYADMPLKTAAGRQINVEFVSNVYRVDNQTVIQCNIRDITERKQAEEALALSRQRMALHIEQTPLAVIEWDENFKVREWNPAAEKIFGYTSQEALGRHWDFIVPKFTREAVGKVGKALVRQAGGQRSSNENITKTGKIIVCEWFNTTLVDSEGKTMGVASLVEDVTDRRRAEEALRESEFWLQESQRVSKIGSYSLDIATRKWTSTQSLDAIFGIGPRYKKTVGGWARIIHPDHREEMLDYLKKEVIGKGKRFAREYKICRQTDGAARWVSGLGLLIPGAQGKPAKMVGTIQDITERKVAEEEALKTQLQYQELVENAKDGIFTIDLNGNFLLTNPEFRTMLGYGKKEFTRLSIFDTYPRGQRRVSQERMKRLQHGEMLRFERPMKRKDGSFIFIEASVWKTQEGCIQAFVRDITDRKRSEEALKEHRRQLLQIIDAVPHMVFAQDQQGRFLLVNQAVGSMYGKDPQQLIGMKRRDVHPVPEEVEKFLEAERRVLASGKPVLVAGETCTDVMGRKHILQTVKIPFKMAGLEKEAILGVSVDVTEQKKVEEFRNDIVRTVSHELRTPLSIQKEGVNLVLDGTLGSLSPKQEMVLQTVMRSTNRLSRMISGLLDISRIESGKIELRKERTVLEDIFKDVAFEFQKRFEEKGLEIQLNLPEGVTAVLADPDKITQVLTNLVDNALKFTEKGVVEISLAALKGEIECTVRDTGIGIAPENISKIFEKFQQFGRTAGPGEKGLGLGLSIAKEIIGMHGGRIWAQSELGKGTEITFTLPLFPRKGVL